MDTIKKILKTQHIFWLLVCGVALMVYGVHWWYKMYLLESQNALINMPRSLKIIYNIIGKTGIAVFYEILAISMLIQGIKAIKNGSDKQK